MAEFTDGQWAEFLEFVRGLPDVAMLRDFPLGAAVQTKPGVLLLVPAPRVTGHVAGYSEEDGELAWLIVTAPMTIPHPVHGWGRGSPGQILRAEIKPEKLTVVDRGPLSEAQIERAITEAAGG